MARKEFVFAGIERRRLKRFPCWAMVAVNEINLDNFSLTSGNTNDFFASCSNLTEEGMLLESYEKFKIGTVLSLNISLPHEDDGSHYHFVGKVIHSFKHSKANIQSVGVKFLSKPKNFDAIITTPKNTK